MKLSAAFLCVAASAQTLTLTGPATARQGTTVTVSMRLSGSSSTGPAGLQWSGALPSGFTSSAPTVTAASKSLQCGVDKCLLFGMNQTSIANGAVVTFRLTVPAQAPTGYAQLSLSNLVGASRTGSTMSVARGSTYAIYVTRR
jgi:hypothetical protein